MKIKAIILSLSCLALLGVFSQPSNAVWKKDNNGWWYSYENNYSLGWDKIGGDWYYFDKNGYMKSNWIYIGNNWYYLNSDGQMQTGFIDILGKIYYLSQDGQMKRGSLIIDDIKYNFALSGELLGDKIPNVVKVFSEDGKEIISDKKEVEIDLEGNPTTGYEWTYIISIPDVIKETMNEYIQYSPDKDIVGAGGTFKWRFIGIKEGKTEVTFNYGRSWEDEVISSKKYIFEVDKNLNVTVKEQSF